MGNAVSYNSALTGANANVQVPVVLSQSAVPVGLAPNATWNGGSGAFTLGTALPTTYAGMWLYFSGVGVNGSGGGPTGSGLYWCVMNSTTQGQAFALQQVSSSVAVPITLATSAFTSYIPSGTQLSGLLPTTAGSHVQTTGSDIAFANITVPGGLMGANGALRPVTTYSVNNNANAKTPKFVFGGSVFGGASIPLASAAGAQLMRGISNRGTLASQMAYGTSALNSLSGGTPQFFSINTAVDQPLTFTGNLAVATDYIVLEGFTVEVLPAA